jgi:hypothetical protein
METPNTQSTIINIDWEFDIEQDEQTQEMLGLSEGDIEVILEDPERLAGYKRDVSMLFGVPQQVDLIDYFEDPRSVSPEQITDALSDEFGWLINNYAWHEPSCN